MFRKNVSVILIILSILFIYSCAAATANPEIRRKASIIRILNIEDVPLDRQFEIVGEALGVSCGKQLGNEPSLEMAKQNMKIDAAKFSADAIINVMCEETGVDMIHNCWESIQCRGDAIKFTN